MCQSQSSVCGSGLPLPAAHTLLKQPPQGELLVSATNGTQGFLARLCPTSCLGSTVAFSCFVEAHTFPETWRHKDTNLVHRSHRGFCPSSSPVLGHHLTTHTDIPKPLSHSQIVFYSTMFFIFFFPPLFFFPLLASKESFIFPIKLLVKSQLQSLYSLSLKLNYLSLNTEIPVRRKSPPSKARASTRDALPVFSH